MPNKKPFGSNFFQRSCDSVINALLDLKYSQKEAYQLVCVPTKQAFSIANEILQGGIPTCLCAYQASIQHGQGNTSRRHTNLFVCLLRKRSAQPRKCFKEADQLVCFPTRQAFSIAKEILQGGIPTCLFAYQTSVQHGQGNTSRRHTNLFVCLLRKRSAQPRKCFKEADQLVCFPTRQAFSIAKEILQGGIPTCLFAYQASVQHGQGNTSRRHTNLFVCLLRKRSARQMKYFKR